MPHLLLLRAHKDVEETPSIAREQWFEQIEDLEGKMSLPSFVFGTMVL